MVTVVLFLAADLYSEYKDRQADLADDSHALQEFAQRQAGRDNLQDYRLSAYETTQDRILHKLDEVIRRLPKEAK